MKYYTPDLEEFHIGFEYEFLEQHGSPEETWVKKTLMEISDGEDDMYLGNTFHAIEKYERVYLRNAVRVKVLDEEDIKELGWKKIYENTKDISTHKEIIFEYTVYRLSWYPYINEIQIYFHLDESTITFDGQIKNKSELKRLMKQLGI